MKIWELYTDASKWTQRYYAKDSNGIACVESSPAAVCWCLEGALIRCYPDAPKRWPIRWRISDAAKDLLTKWNDAPDRTFAEVYDLVKRLDV